jgi:hypothetical protein
MTQYTSRLSPSGPLIGNPPALVGGGAAVPGCLWLAQGTGSSEVPYVNVPNPAAAITGLEAVPVDLKPGTTGYKYDIEVDTATFGTGGGFTMNLAESTDGVTYTVIYTPQGLIDNTGEERLHLTNYSNPHATSIKFVKAIVSTSQVAGGALTYAPLSSSVRIREWSKS